MIRCRNRTSEQYQNTIAELIDKQCDTYSIQMLIKTLPQQIFIWVYPRMYIYDNYVIPLLIEFLYC